jgi:glutamyl/glutaminyl-tRNA synthetase
MPNPYTGRIAPSPTGLLHLGHARTFWTAHERAQQHNGTLILRNEDLDPQRSKQEFVEAMREDLAWLGITWASEHKQSDRIPLYREALTELLRRGHAYACTCSRKDLQQATQAPHEDDDEPIYTGRCRPPNASQTEFLEATNYRFRVPDREAIRFDDIHAGPQTFKSGCDSHADFGDFLIWRKDGLPSYQLACVVDDDATGITEVVRGRDLLKSTARQILLQRVLNLPTPAYFHCDLMRDDAGVRLAKRHDALALRTLREHGYTLAEIRAMF